MPRLTERRRRLSDVKCKGLPSRGPRRVTLQLEETTANVIRKLAKHEGADLTTLLDEAVRCYLKEHHPTWKVEETAPRRARFRHPGSQNE